MAECLRLCFAARVVLVLGDLEKPRTSFVDGLVVRVFVDEVFDAGEVETPGEGLLLFGVVESVWLVGACPVQEDRVGGATGR